MLDVGGGSLHSSTRVTLQSSELSFRREPVSPESQAVSPAAPLPSSSSDTVTLSAPATEQLLLYRGNAPLRTTSNEGVEAQQNGEQTSEQPAAATSREKKLEQTQEYDQLRRLAAIDRDVRAHEAAHANSGGSLAGSPRYEYTRGPDGKLYATGGEVSIDTRPIADDPEATIEKAQAIIQAALAPANPSPQDIQVAAQAQALLVEAQAELLALAESGESRPGLSAEKAEEAGEEAEKEAEKEDGDQRADGPSAFAQNREAIEQRLARSRDERQEFAQQLHELNSRVNDFQQYLADIGAIDTLKPGAFLDLLA